MKNIKKILSLLLLTSLVKADDCCEKYNFYLMTESGWSWSNKANICADTSFWDEANEGYNSKLGRGYVASAEVGVFFNNWLSLGSSYNFRGIYEYCKNHPCSVYIALIANDVKVGVSFNPLKRWINQGADLAVEVIRAKNGFEARSLEKAISSDLHISQTIRKTTKARKLNFDLSRSKPGFRTILDEVKSYIDKSGYETKDSDLLNKEQSLKSYYGDIPSLQSNPILNEVEKTLQITGEIIGVKGKLLVTKANNSFYVTNLSKIIGHMMSFSESALKIKGQQSLECSF